MKANIVMIEPEYPGNIGLICRVMKNFGFSELILVNPQIDHLSGEAYARAMHASDVLKKAKIVSSLEEAISKSEYAVATTAKITKGHKLFRTPLTAKEFADKFLEGNAKVAIVLGRDSTGLTNSEIRACDFVVHIPASRQYSTLNISHSAAVILYELFQKTSKREFKTADTKSRKLLIDKFEKFIRNQSHIKNRKNLMIAFKGLVSRAMITDKEASSLMSAFDDKSNK
ncbi:MAG: RNA methyltransferase [Candidatus Diapherotrites archaeon]